jgi:hypothetical protein
MFGTWIPSAAVMLLAVAAQCDASVLNRETGRLRPGTRGSSAAHGSHAEQLPLDARRGQRKLWVCADLVEDPATGRYATLAAAVAALPPIAHMAAVAPATAQNIEISLCEGYHSTVGPMFWQLPTENESAQANCHIVLRDLRAPTPLRVNHICEPTRPHIGSATHAVCCCQALPHLCRVLRSTSCV